VKWKWLVLILLSYSAWGAVRVPEENFDQIIFNVQLPMEKRWEAYHQAIKQNKKGSFTLAKKAIRSPDWFLREAGLKTYVALDPKEAKNIARKLFQEDPSLLVRVQALSALKIMNDKKSENLLWQALSDPKNFRGEQSLWIRPQIVATLMEFRLGQKSQFQKLTEDRDVQVQRLAKIAISKF